MCAYLSVFFADASRIILRVARRRSTGFDRGRWRAAVDLAYRKDMFSMLERGLLTVALLALATSRAVAADCDRSESRRTPSPDGRWIASVQEEVCAGERSAAAGITVVVSAANDETHAQRVFITAVPRSREDWPRARWRNDGVLELRVPNLAEIASPPLAQYEGIRIELEYCNDAPEDRRRLADYKIAVKQWQRDVSAWAERRKQDADGAGPRPPRPEEPRLPQGRCTD